jgi:DNA-binding Xre family transcriptional regulator
MTTLKNPKGKLVLRLDELLAERGLGVCEFAKLSGLEYHTIGSLISGKWKRIGLETLYSLAFALKVQPGELFRPIDFSGMDDDKEFQK